MRKIIKFGAKWCSACNTLDELIKSSDISPDLVTYIDIDDDMDSARFYKIRTLPTVIILNKNGEEIIRIHGKDATIEVIKKCII